MFFWLFLDIISGSFVLVSDLCCLILGVFLGLTFHVFLLLLDQCFDRVRVILDSVFVISS